MLLILLLGESPLLLRALTTLALGKANVILQGALWKDLNCYLCLTPSKDVRTHQDLRWLLGGSTPHTALPPQHLYQAFVFCNTSRYITNNIKENKSQKTLVGLEI